MQKERKEILIKQKLNKSNIKMRFNNEYPCSTKTIKSNGMFSENKASNIFSESGETTTKISNKNSPENKQKPNTYCFHHRSQSLSPTSAQKVKQYFQQHRIESIFDQLKHELAENLPKNPLLFLRNILIHKEAEHQYKKIRHKNLAMTMAHHQPVVFDVSNIDSLLFESKNACCEKACLNILNNTENQNEFTEKNEQEKILKSSSSSLSKNEVEFDYASSTTAFTGYESDCSSPFSTSSKDEILNSPIIKNSQTKNGVVKTEKEFSIDEKNETRFQEQQETDYDWKHLRTSKKQLLMFDKQRSARLAKENLRRVNKNCINSVSQTKNYENNRKNKDKNSRNRRFSNIASRLSSIRQSRFFKKSSNQLRFKRSNKKNENILSSKFGDSICVSSDTSNFTSSNSSSSISEENHDKSSSPQHFSARRQTLRRLKLLRHPLIGMDIGGSLSKICLYEPFNKDENCLMASRKLNFLKNSIKYGTSGHRDTALSFEYGDGKFHFITFETRRMEGAIQMMSENNLFEPDEIILATGGGAHKFSDMFSDRIEVRLVKGDELTCLLNGLNFLLQHQSDECYYFTKPHLQHDSSICSYEISNFFYPYLLVNIGSGVSILRVDGHDSYERVSGTCIGGGTYLGLCKLLTKCSNFDESTRVANEGDSTKVDMLVSDIYGGDYDRFALKGDVVASAFGKILMKDEPLKDVSEGDITRSLINMIGINIAQLAYLCAMRYKITRILFAGNFLRQNPLTQNAIAFSVDYQSQRVMKALFLRHEGYFGAVGAFLLPDGGIQ